MGVVSDLFGGGSVPQPPPIKPDPMMSQLNQQAQAQSLQSLQGLASGDFANLMARYGSLLSLAGTKGSSLLAAPIVRGPSASK